VTVISDGTGSLFRAYVVANTTAADARLDLSFSNLSSTFTLDNVGVKQVTGLTNNPRTNEARLIANGSVNSGNFSCPGGGGCPLQYRDISDNAVSFPINLAGFTSQIVLWRDPNSNFTPTNIIHRPTGSLVPSAGSIPNGMTVDLTWTSTNSLINTLSGSILGG
jgi:hypothetical protein